MSRSAAVALLLRLHEQDIRVEVAGDRLRVNAPTGVVTSATRDALRTLKPDLKAFLSIPGFTEHDLSALSRLMLEFGAEIVAVVDCEPGEGH